MDRLVRPRTVHSGRHPYPLSANETFFDPNLGQNIGTDTHVYQYNFPNLSAPCRATSRRRRAPSIGSKCKPACSTAPWARPATFGWKTADPNILPQTLVPPQNYSFRDDAVFADTNGFADPNVNLPWRDMHYPAGNPFAGQSVDLSFVLTSVPEPSSIALAGLGLVALVGTTWRRASKSRAS